MLSVILNSTSITDLLTNIEMSKKIYAADSDLLYKLKVEYDVIYAAKLELSDLKESLEAQQADMEATKAALAYDQQVAAEKRAADFLRQHRTISGLGQTDMKNNKNYLATKNCVIFLLETKGYFTRSMLVRLVEDEQVCYPGKKGEHIVKRYLPTIRKDLGLYKDHCTQFLKERVRDSSLKIGASVLYYRGDLLDYDNLCS